MSKKANMLFGLIAVFVGFILIMGQVDCKSSSTTPSNPVAATVTCQVNNTQGQMGAAFQFSCTPSGGNGSFTFSWNFGDGQTSTQQNPSHSYSVIGNFSVKVAVTSNGQTANCNLTVKVFVQQSVFVGAGGGSANVIFRTAQAARIRITLNTIGTLVPYGYLEGPGYSDYFPPEATANGGVNVGEINLGQAGTFTLTVFEGYNIGGNFNVTIEVI